MISASELDIGISFVARTQLGASFVSSPVPSGGAP